MEICSNICSLRDAPLIRPFSVSVISSIYKIPNHFEILKDTPYHIKKLQITPRYSKIHTTNHSKILPRYFKSSKVRQILLVTHTITSVKHFYIPTVEVVVGGRKRFSACQKRGKVTWRSLRQSKAAAGLRKTASYRGHRSAGQSQSAPILGGLNKINKIYMKLRSINNYDNISILLLSFNYQFTLQNGMAKGFQKASCD